MAGRATTQAWADGLARGEADARRSVRRSASAAPASVRRAVASPGEPLPAAARHMLGPGTDFAAVRVHSDASARDLGAEAYTAGSHVVFAPGRYAPQTRPGMRLLAHELTHVAQQRHAVPRPDGELPVGGADDAAEREASLTADR